MHKKVFEGSKTTVTEYLDGYQYVDGKLEFYPHSEGYVKVKEDNTLQYVYNYTDHLGNVRLSYTKGSDGKAQVVEESNYYPFGLKHSTYNTVVDPIAENYKYGYNRKEFEDDLGVNWYSYGFRNYDPSLGRWMNMDPVAENAVSWTGYRYGFNNPMFYIDPNGLFETKAEARQYRRDNNLGGSYIAKKNEEGTYDLVSRKHGVSYSTIGTDDQGNQMADIDGVDDGVAMTMDKVEQAPNEVDYLSALTNIGGATTGIGAGYLFNSRSGYWLGKNGKFYSTSWGGNGATGGKFKWAQSTSKTLGRVGAGLTLVGMATTYSDWDNNKKSTSTMIQDQAFNAVGFAGPYGAAASFGYNSGYMIEDACDCNIQINWPALLEGGGVNWSRAFEPLEGRDYFIEGKTYNDW